MSELTAIRHNDIERPVLQLSGDAIRMSMQTMVKGSEELGGIERYVDAVKLKSTMFQQALDDIDNLELEAFMGLCTFMATVRRRIGPWLNENSFAEVREALAGLFDDGENVDARVDAFCGHFPNDKKHRWVRDLATEILHNTSPERFPLMNRWVWDAQANTGVLREIWHADNIDHITIQVGDGYGTYLMLREELSQFLSDFSAPEDPMQHTRRLLGLDGVRPGNGRTRLKSIDGEAFVIDDSNLLK
jgi:hypothetical protein